MIKPNPYHNEHASTSISLNALDQCNIGIILIDSNYEILIWNQWIEQHSGKKSKRMLGLNLLTVFPQLKHNRFKSAIEQTIEHNRSTYLSHRIHGEIFNLQQSNQSTKLEHSLVTKPISDNSDSRYCLIEVHDSSLQVKHERIIEKQTFEIKTLYTESLIGHTISDALFDLCFDCLIIINDQGRIKRCNKMAEKTFGDKGNELTGRLIQSLLEKSDKQTIDIQNDFKSKPNELPLIGINKNNQRFPALVSIAGLNNSTNNDLLLIVHNETRYQEIQQQLTSIKSRSELTLNAITDAVVVTNIHGQITFMNKAAEQITAWSQKDALGQAAHIVLSLIDIDNNQALTIYDFKTKNNQQHAARLNRKDHMQIRVDFSVAPLVNNLNKKSGLVIVLHNLTERVNAAQKIAWQSTHDALTGLINKQEFEKIITTLLNHQPTPEVTHTLLYIDIDQFKVVNDLCGHLAGDNLLRQFSDFLNKLLPETAIFARFAADEFGILLSDNSIEDAQKCANLIHSRLKSFRFEANEKIFALSVSIGLILLAQQNGNATEQLGMADTACFLAKESGRNRTYTALQNDDQLIKRRDEMTWISKIQYAIDNNNIILFGQIIAPVDHASQLRPRIEILARMVENEKLISPAHFVVAAERYDLMPTLDREIVKKAIKILPQLDSSSEVCININLSAKSINDCDFLPFLIELVTTSKVNPNAICFEITETAALNNMDVAINFIKRLKEIGCEFALDDFGSGLCSIAYLKSLPVDYLKIDGSFVQNILNNPVDLEMLDIINRLGKVMKVKTIAEYVESKEINDKLLTLGVDFAQGYAISKPAPLNEIVKDLQSYLK